MLLNHSPPACAIDATLHPSLHSNPHFVPSHPIEIGTSGKEKEPWFAREVDEGDKESQGEQDSYLRYSSPKSISSFATAASLDLGSLSRNSSVVDSPCISDDRQVNGDVVDLTMDFAQSTAAAWMRGPSAAQGLPSGFHSVEPGSMQASAANGMPGMTDAEVTTSQLQAVAPFLRVPALQGEHNLHEGLMTMNFQDGQSYPQHYYKYPMSFQSDASSISGYSTMSSREGSQGWATTSQDTSNVINMPNPNDKRIELHALPLHHHSNSADDDTTRSSFSSTGHESLCQPTPKSHSRKKPPGHIKRPLNAFFLFRKHVSSNNLIPKTVAVSDQRAISRIIACMWQNLPSDWQDEWRKEYQREKEAFDAAHPEYRYQPDTKASQRKAKRNLKDEQCSQDQCKVIADAIFQSYDAPQENVLQSKKPVKAKPGVKTKDSPNKGDARKRGGRADSKDDLKIKASPARRTAKSKSSAALNTDANLSESSPSKTQLKKASSSPRKPGQKARGKITSSSKATTAEDTRIDSGVAGYDFAGSLARDPISEGPTTDDTMQYWNEGLAEAAASSALSNLTASTSTDPLPQASVFGHATSFSSPMQSAQEFHSPIKGSIRRKKMPPPQLQLSQKPAPKPRAKTPRFFSVDDIALPRSSDAMHFDIDMPTARPNMTRNRPHNMMTPRDDVFKMPSRGNLSSTLYSPAIFNFSDRRLAGEENAESTGRSRRGSLAMPSANIFNHDKDANNPSSIAHALAFGSGAGWTPIRSAFGLNSAGLSGVFPRVHRMSFAEQRRASITADSFLDASIGLSPRAIAENENEMGHMHTRSEPDVFGPHHDLDAGHVEGSDLHTLGQLLSPTSASLSLQANEHVPDFDFSLPTPRPMMGVRSFSMIDRIPTHNSQEDGSMAMHHSHSQQSLQPAISLTSETERNSGLGTVPRPCAQEGSLSSMDSDTTKQDDSVFHFGSDFIDAAEPSSGST